MKNFLRLIGAFSVLIGLAALALAAGAPPVQAMHAAATLASGSALSGAHAFSLLGMAIGQTVNYQTVSALNKGYRRSTTKLYRTYTRTVPEYEAFDDIPDEDIIPSGRENDILLDVAVGVGAHQADDAGYESRTETPVLQEGSFVFNHTNSRFSISLRAQAFDRVARGNQIIRQIKYQSLKCIEAVMRKYGFMTYGFSSGVVALVSGSPGTGTTLTITVTDAFGYSGITNVAYIISALAVDEGVGFVRSNALVGTGTITANDPVAGTISVDFAGVSTTIDNGDQILFANGVIGATLSETDWQKWNTGILEALTATTVHNVSSSAVPTWAPSLLDTNGGSFDFVKARKIRQALENKGDTTLRKLIVSNGVQNDRDSRERAALIWTNTTSMSLDGNATLKNVKEFTSRFVPPTCAFGIGADAMGKKVLTDKPDAEETIEFGKLYKAEDRSALKGGVDLISAMIYRSRSRLTAYIGLNEK